MPILSGAMPFSVDLINAQQQDRFSRIPLWVWILGVMVIVVVVGIIVTLREEQETAELRVKAPPRPDADLSPGGSAVAQAARVAEAESESVPPVSEAAAPPPRPDNLKRIKGIGPKIETLLKDNGIATFAQLAETEVSRLQTLLDEAGWDKIANPDTWPEQARQLAQ